MWSSGPGLAWPAMPPFSSRPRRPWTMLSLSRPWLFMGKRWRLIFCRERVLHAFLCGAGSICLMERCIRWTPSDLVSSRTPRSCLRPKCHRQGCRFLHATSAVCVTTARVHALSVPALEVPHATTGKRKASHALLISGPSAPPDVLSALASAHSRLSMSPPPLPRACNTPSRTLDASDPFGIFSLNRTCRRKQHGAPPKTGGRASKPEDV